MKHKLLVIGTIVISLVAASVVVATANTKLDVFRDCDVGGCNANNPLDMLGPEDQGFVNYNQDGETGDLRVTVKLHKSGAPNTTYEVFLTCGPGGVSTPHAESCGFDSIGTLTTNKLGTGNSGALIVPKCQADALISGNPFTTGQQAHVDLLSSVGDNSNGVFVATPIDFDPDVGPSCTAFSSSASAYTADPAW